MSAQWNRLAADREPTGGPEPRDTTAKPEDPCPRSRRAVDLTLLATGRGPIDGGFAEGSQPTPDGCDRTGRSVRQDLFAVQRAADRQEEDPRQEANAEPGVQRELRVRHPVDGGSGRHAGGSFPGTDAAGLGSGYQERSDWTSRAGRTEEHRIGTEPLEGGVQFSPQADCRLAQAEGVEADDGRSFG